MDLSIRDEYAPLESVIIGLGSPYQRDKAQVAREMQEFPLLPDTARKAEVLALTYPCEDDLIREYRNYVGVLEAHGVDVLFADPAAAYSFDYTCPRDIGFVIGDRFFVARMAVASRADEIRTIEAHLAGIDASRILRPPPDCRLEGGDVMVWDETTVLVGYHQRSNRAGAGFLEACLAPLGYRVIAIAHRQLHLDCCLNPLGLGHLLIHPASLIDIGDEAFDVLRQKTWIEVDDVEREHLATNLLSIRPDTLIARNHPSCRRVNARLRELGYNVEAVTFDGVPATGGSFRCASLALRRE